MRGRGLYGMNVDEDADDAHPLRRLTPALFFALGLSHCVALYLQHSSAHYVDEHFDLYCTK